jgi:hypothetical protein
MRPQTILYAPLTQYLLRTVLGCAGKTILHRGKVCEVLEAREHIRQLLPLGSTAPFWVPRRPRDRKRLNIERRDRSRRHRVLHVPRTTDEVLVPVPWTFPSAFPDRDYVMALVRECGYPFSAARSAMSATPRVPAKGKGPIFLPKVPPTKESLMRAAKQMKSGNNYMRLGVTELIEVGTKKAAEVAEKYGLNVVSLKKSYVRNYQRAELVEIGSGAESTG